MNAPGKNPDSSAVPKPLWSRWSPARPPPLHRLLIATIPGSKAQSLFGFLVLHPAIPHTRDALADLLWPEAPPDRVRHYLSDLLYRLRQALGPNWLSVEAKRVALRVDADLWVDVWEFEQLARSNDPAALDRAVHLYAGDLLPEIYDDWVLAPRISLREKYLGCLLRLGQATEQGNQRAAALDYYHRLAHADPLREEAYCGLMPSLASMGRLADALDAYARLERVLDEHTNFGFDLLEIPARFTRLGEGLEGFSACRDVRAGASLWSERPKLDTGPAVGGDPGLHRLRIVDYQPQRRSWRGHYRQIEVEDAQELTAGGERAVGVPQAGQPAVLLPQERAIRGVGAHGEGQVARGGGVRFPGQPELAPVRGQRGRAVANQLQPLAEEHQPRLERWERRWRLGWCDAHQDAPQRQVVVPGQLGAPAEE